MDDPFPSLSPPPPPKKKYALATRSTASNAYFFPQSLRDTKTRFAVCPSKHKYNYKCIRRTNSFNFFLIQYSNGLSRNKQKQEKTKSLVLFMLALIEDIINRMSVFLRTTPSRPYASSLCPEKGSERLGNNQLNQRPVTRSVCYNYLLPVTRLTDLF